MTQNGKDKWGSSLEIGFQWEAEDEERKIVFIVYMVILEYKLRNSGRWMLMERKEGQN